LNEKDQMKTMRGWTVTHKSGIKSVPKELVGTLKIRAFSVTVRVVGLGL